MSTVNEVVLKEDKNRGFRLWRLEELWMGDGSEGRFVPNLDDAVLSWTSGMSRVVYVDPTTKVPTLKPVDTVELSGVKKEEALLGANIGQPSESYRIYVNDSVVPNTFTVDSRLRVYGTANVKYKVFLGRDIGQHGTVISARYDQNNNVVDDAIELETVGSDPLSSTAIKVPRSGHTNYALDDGELLTLVIYNNEGNVSSINRMLAVNTAFVKSASNPVKHVTGVRLVSPFLSSDLNNTVVYPLNLPLTSMKASAVVEYSDGTVQNRNIDGQTTTLHGLDDYLPSIVGQRIPLVLTYKLDDDESTFTGNSNVGIVSERYTAITEAADVAYQVKLFVAPQWIDDVNGYKLRFFLYNMERQLALDVTQYVDFDVNGANAFQPTFYGIEQTLAAVLNLKDVDPSYMDYRHIQTFKLVLKGPAHSEESPWYLDYNSDGDMFFGLNTYACSNDLGDGTHEVFISSEHDNLSDWLNDVYVKTDPLVNVEAGEGHAVTPTHMRVVIDRTEFRRPVTDWQETFIVDFVPNASCNVDIHWIKETATGDLELAQSTLNMYINK
jgi:hypothetical protein